MRIVEPSVRFVTATSNPERVIEAMGRICYQSDHKVKKCEVCNGDGRCAHTSMDLCSHCNGTGTDLSSAIEFVKKIRTNGHESVLEHASASFSVVTDRGITHEKVRHRIASFSQESTRYCNYIRESFGSSITVIEPPFSNPALSHSIWRKAVEFAEASYFELLKFGETAQIARSVLPTCLKAEIGMTANFREWRHFLKLRTSPKAHPQMRQIAEMLRDHLLALSPVCFEDIPCSL